MANVETLKGIVSIIEAIEKGEATNGIFLSGVCEMVYADGTTVGELYLNGDGEHELNIRGAA